MQLEEFHQRPTYRIVVLDYEHEAGGILRHNTDVRSRQPAVGVGQSGVGVRAPAPAIIFVNGGFTMRTAIAVVVGILLIGSGRAAGQFGQRRLSPHESVSERIDNADITIVYGRPSMRGRTIFGSLVPYGRVWAPGADAATTLESTRPLQLGTLAVPRGPHTIWILPTPEAWTLIVSKEPSGFHTFYHKSEDLGRMELRKRALPAPVEQLTFAIPRNPSGPGGTIVMTWETTEVSVPFTVEQ